jgi:hypothetical protein
LGSGFSFRFSRDLGRSAEVVLAIQNLSLEAVREHAISAPEPLQEN